MMLWDENGRDRYYNTKNGSGRIRIIHIFLKAKTIGNDIKRQRSAQEFPIPL